MSTDETALNAAFASILAEAFEREAEHWNAEYSHLAQRGGPRKVMAAWRLGAGILLRRAEQYRSGQVTYLLPPDDLARVDRIERDRQVAEQAWREGFLAGYADGTETGETDPTNPLPRRD